MKKIYHLILICLMIVGTCSCSCNNKENDKIEYTHYANGGVTQKLKASILWEYSNDTFTKYQVSYNSYVCSNTSVNYTNVIYIELTNKGSKEDSVIRNVSFTTVEETNGDIFNVGLWGDYKEYSGQEFYMGVEEELLPKLKYMKYADISALAEKGYKNFTYIEDIDADALAGGTVSSSNVVSIVKAIFDYHIANHY